MAKSIPAIPGLSPRSVPALPPIGRTPALPSTGHPVPRTPASSKR
ncbi:hypothetical protein BJY18_007110 [Amycolatopsis jiangsuensis]|uniref:Uncharacterized protein n=1 Tax=Amycolatopsis jiangsuensis TaxID=1181879 RepID=A0A840J7P3_9PSEU|nr:hypothetical protein [Amycolatopsis jiangsuensis]